MWSFVVDRWLAVKPWVKFSLVKSHHQFENSSELKQLYDDDKIKAMEYLQLIIEFESLENKMFGL